MTFDYAAIANVAREQLLEFGQTVKLRNHTPGTYDPATNETTQPAEVEHDRLAAIFDFARGQTENQGTLIQSGDKRAIMEVGVKPSTEDELIDAEGIVYAVVAVGEINPAGTPVVYTLHLRR